MQNLTHPLLAIGVAIAAAITADSAPLQEQPPVNEAAAAQTPTDLATLQKQFSTWKLRTWTDATWEGAGAELERLVDDVKAAALAAPKDQALRSFLSDTYARAIQWTALRGDVESTAERIVGLRLQATERSAFPRRTIVLAAAMTLARADVIEIEKSLPEGAQRASLPAAGSHAEDVVIARAVREAVARGDEDFLSKLGTKAVPALTDLAHVMDGAPIPTGEADPFAWIFRTETAAGLDVALELLQRDEYLLLKSVQHLLAESSIFHRPQVWKPVGETNWQLASPEWVEILRRLVAQGDTPNMELAKIVSAFAQHGAIPRDLAPTCASILSSVPGVSIRPRVPAESGTWFYLDLLESDSANIRARAAEALLASQTPNVVLGLARDPSEDVRKKIAGAMGQFSAWEWTDGTRRGRPDQVQRSFAIDTAYVGALRAFVVDPNVDMRLVALSGAHDLSVELERSALDGPTIRELIAASPDNVAYRLLTMARFLPDEERLPTVATYIDHVGRSGRDEESRDSVLVSLLSLSAYGLTAREHFWPVAERIEAVAPDSARVEVGIAAMATNFIQSDEMHTAEFVAWLHGDRGDEVWLRVIGQFLQNVRVKIDDEWLGRASSEERAQIVRLLGERPLPWGGGKTSTPAVSSLRHGRIGIHSDDLVTLIEDDAAPWLSRSWAAKELATESPQSLTSELVPVLAEVLGKTSEFIQIHQVARNPDAPELPLDILDAMLADRTVKETWLADQKLSLTRDSTVELVLERFPPETWAKYPSSDLLENLVRILVRRSVDKVDPRLSAANIRGSSLQGWLAYEIGVTRSDALFPLLGDILRNASIHSDGYKNGLRAVTGYLNDDAAALLLETARATSSEEDRTVIMANLEQILAWQDAAARWEKGRGAAARRMTAIDELIAMADDADQPSTIRAEALRGLGLLGAAEELPRLVRALTDPDATIRKAARDAIDRLHADDGQAERDE